MKQVLYRCVFLILFIFIITMLSGIPASKACDNKAVLGRSVIKKQVKPSAEVGKVFPDFTFVTSIFQF